MADLAGKLLGDLFRGRGGACQSREGQHAPDLTGASGRFESLDDLWKLQGPDHPLHHVPQVLRPGTRGQVAVETLDGFGEQLRIGSRSEGGGHHGRSREFRGAQGGGGFQRFRGLVPEPLQGGVAVGEVGPFGVKVLAVELQAGGLPAVPHQFPVGVEFLEIVPDGGIERLAEEGLRGLALGGRGEFPAEVLRLQAGQAASPGLRPGFPEPGLGHPAELTELLVALLELGEHLARGLLQRPVRGGDPGGPLGIEPFPGLLGRDGVSQLPQVGHDGQVLRAAETVPQMGERTHGPVFRRHEDGRGRERDFFVLDIRPGQGIQPGLVPKVIHPDLGGALGHQDQQEGLHEIAEVLQPALLDGEFLQRAEEGQRQRRLSAVQDGAAEAYEILPLEVSLQQRGRDLLRVPGPGILRQLGLERGQVLLDLANRAARAERSPEFQGKGQPLLVHGSGFQSPDPGEDLLAAPGLDGIQGGLLSLDPAEGRLEESAGHEPGRGPRRQSQSLAPLRQLRDLGPLQGLGLVEGGLESPEHLRSAGCQEATGKGRLELVAAGPDALETAAGGGQVFQFGETGF